MEIQRKLEKTRENTDNALEQGARSDTQLAEPGPSGQRKEYQTKRLPGGRPKNGPSWA